jgi:hypothetical protein
MGFRQLPRRGQLRVDDDHHFRVHFEGGREEGPQPFAAEADKSTRGQGKHSFEANLDFAYIIPLFQF